MMEAGGACPKCGNRMYEIYPRDYVCERCGYEEYYDFKEHKIKKVI